MSESIGSVEGRSRNLTLDVPGYQKRESRLPSIAELVHKCGDLAAFPARQLVEFRGFIYSLNRTKLASNKRFELLEQSVPLLSPAIRHIFSEYHKSHPLPEKEQRREALTLAVDVCHEYASGYMRMFMHDVNLSTIRYRRVRDRIPLCAHKALEMIYVEQRLRALRYQCLTEETWLNVNGLFFSFFRNEDIEYKARSLGCLLLQAKLKEARPVSPPELTLREIFVAIQLTGRMDMLSMATQQIHIAGSYIQTESKKSQISKMSVGPIPRNHLLIYPEQKGPPLLKAAHSNNAGITIDVGEFKIQLKREYGKIFYDLEGPDQLAAEGEQFITVTGHEDIEKLLALMWMSNSLENGRRKHEREYIGNLGPVYIYNGFKPCFKIMADQQQASKEIEADNHFRGLLAERSAVVADDERDSDRSRWMTINDSQGGVLLETYESEFTRSMFVGQLALYGNSADPDVVDSSGYISRMYRENVGAKLQMAIVKVSQQSEVVAVQSAFLEKSALALPAILLFDYGEELALLLHISHRLSADTAINVLRKGKRCPYTIGEILLIRREFVIYQLKSTE